jgi:hypothetical protein
MSNRKTGPAPEVVVGFIDGGIPLAIRHLDGRCARDGVGLMVRHGFVVAGAAA